MNEKEQKAAQKFGKWEVKLDVAIYECMNHSHLFQPTQG